MAARRRTVAACALAAALLSLLVTSISAVYKVGVGKSDVTGPAAEIVMMGYADSSQTTAGLLNRLYARAFIVEDTAASQRVVFVNCDLHSIMQQVQQELVQRLAAKYPSLYSAQNVVLHATHTHGGPGGASAYFLYAVSVRGFNRQNFERIVDGIIDAVDRAHASLAPGSVHYNNAPLRNGGKQRSPLAYLANPEAERAKYTTDHDVDMRVLQFKAHDGSLRGVLAWYPVHPTSLTRFNRLITGDNKGYAEFLVEEQFPGVVVGIGISNAGDVSPNLVDNGDTTFVGEGQTDIESAEIMGSRQAATVVELLNLQAEELKGSVSGKLSYVDFSNATLHGVASDASNPYANRTCPAVMGQNFAAGTEDGRGLHWFTEGDLEPNAIFRALGSLVKVTPQWVQACQTKNKVPLLAVGLAWQGPWVPNILPVQVVKLGQFAIAATNFEVSTMAGRRIRSSVLAAMARAGVTAVEVASMSNAYAQYVTTAEEYATQHYEGASTLFGPNQLAVLQQEMVRVAKSVADPSIPFDLGPAPPQFDRSKLLSFQPGVVLDTPGWGKAFGDIRVDTMSVYTVGETVQAEFYGGHPRNRADQIASFCDVETESKPGEWTTRLTDYHWDVLFEWRRVGLTESCSVCKWIVRSGNPSSTPGRYRLRHRGFAKHLLGELRSYEGISSVFDIMPDEPRKEPIADSTCGARGGSVECSAE